MKEKKKIKHKKVKPAKVRVKKERRREKWVTWEIRWEKVFLTLLSFFLSWCLSPDSFTSGQIMQSFWIFWKRPGRRG